MYLRPKFRVISVFKQTSVICTETKRKKQNQFMLMLAKTEDETNGGWGHKCF